MIDDPNAPPDQETEPIVPEPQPEQPEIDIEQALRVVSERYGWNPDLAKFEMEERRRLKDEIARRDRELAERDRRNGYQAPPEYSGDPTFQILQRMDSRLEKIENERREAEDRARETWELNRNLERGYAAFMSRLPESSRIPKDQFFEAMMENYPDQSLLDSVGMDKAIANVYRFYRGGSAQPSYQSTQSQAPRTRRDPIVIPGASTGGAGVPTGAVMPLEPRRSNETEDQFKARYEAWVQQFAPGTGSLRDGQRVSSG